MNNKQLIRANKNKADEFYTQLPDIEKEMKNYKNYFYNKTIFCNCDDPYESNFFKFFAINFNHLKLKKLIATCYSGSPVAYTEMKYHGENALNTNIEKTAYKIEITEVPDSNCDGAVDIFDVNYLLMNKKNIMYALKENGDFRSKECIELLKESDIVVTNPPFSLFREYISQLFEYEKKFIVIGNVNAITYRDIFKYIKDNKIWLGQSIRSGDREFRVPKSYPLKSSGFRIDEKGNKYIRVKGIRWWTNLDYPERHIDIPLYKKYNSKIYPQYDNFNAINVDKTCDIPYDYYGYMGVPITFLDKYNPDQFEILDINPHFFSLVEQNLPKPSQLSLRNVNRKDPYARIIIKRRK